MTNKNVKALLVSIELGNKEASECVVQNREVGQKLLYTTAMREWTNRMGSAVRPNNRKAAVEQFFAESTGNKFGFRQVTVLSAEILSKQQDEADKALGNKVASQKKSKAVQEVAK